jgi:hypothetical protein
VSSTGRRYQLAKLSGQAGLADAGLADQQHELALPGRRRCECCRQLPQLGLSPTNDAFACTIVGATGGPSLAR